MVSHQNRICLIFLQLRWDFVYCTLKNTLMCVLSNALRYLNNALSNKIHLNFALKMSVRFYYSPNGYHPRNILKILIIDLTFFITLGVFISEEYIGLKCSDFFIITFFAAKYSFLILLYFFQEYLHYGL